MTSGPAPTLAATAALGRTSSQFSWSVRTSMPYFSLNFFVLAIHMSSSACTNRFQRRTRSFAPFSGLKLVCACALLIQNIGLMVANALMPPTILRLVRSVMSVSLG